MSDQAKQETFKRWTAKRKSAVVLDIIKGVTTPSEVARKHGLTVAEIEGWMETFLKAGEDRLRSNPRDQKEEWESEKKDLYAKVGELSLQVEVLKKAQGIGRREWEDENS